MLEVPFPAAEAAKATLFLLCPNLVHPAYPPRAARTRDEATVPIPLATTPLLLIVFDVLALEFPGWAVAFVTSLTPLPFVAMP